MVAAPSMVATPAVEAPAKASAGQHVKLSGAGFRAGTAVRIVFDGPRHLVVGSAVARPDGTFKAAIVVPAARPGNHVIQVVGTGSSGRPMLLTRTVAVLASQSVLTSAAGGIAQPVLLTLSVVLPLGTWLALEMFGWRKRRTGKRAPGA
jgi:hypothetical protein